MAALRWADSLRALEYKKNGEAFSGGVSRRFGSEAINFLVQAFAESLSAASAGTLDKKTIAQRAVCEDLSKIRPLAGASANVKSVSNEGP